MSSRKSVFKQFVENIVGSSKQKKQVKKTNKSKPLPKLKAPIKPSKSYSKSSVSSRSFSKKSSKPSKKTISKQKKIVSKKTKPVHKAKPAIKKTKHPIKKKTLTKQKPKTNLKKPPTRAKTKKPAKKLKLKPTLELSPEQQSEKPKPEVNVDIDEVISFLNYEVSPELRKVIKILETEKLISENDIAEKLNMKINGARKLLYILREWGFADYEKKSDENKSWWFIYYWSLSKSKILNRYIFSIKNEIKKREELIKEESEYAFSCPHCELKYTYQEALEQNFSCIQCKGVLENLNNEKLLTKIRNEINRLNKKLEKIQQNF